MTEPCLPAEWLARANRLAIVAALLSTTIHEVNNALQVISGNAEMLRPDTAPDLLMRRSTMIGGQARRGSAVLAELSTFARGDTPEVQRADVTQIAQRALALRQYTRARLGVESRFDAGGASPIAAARPRAVLQILLNLLLNAERALDGRPAGRILVAVNQCGECAEVTVEDNGPGVQPDVEPRLFDAVIGGSGSTLGIGLFVSRWLATRDGGAVSYRPSPAGGCTFTLSVPLESTLQT